MSMEDLVALFEQIQGQAGTGEGDNEPTTTNVKLGEKLERVEGKLDEIASMLGQLMGLGGEGGGMPPPGEGGAMPPGMDAGQVPPELMAALGAGGDGMPPPGGIPSEGAPMDPAMAGGMPPPMIPGGMPPGGPPPGMMPQAGAVDDSGMTKRSAMAIGKLAAKLRKR